MMPFKSMVINMAGITIIGMPLLAWIIMGFFPDVHFFDYMFGEGTIPQHLILGTVSGLLFAFIASWITDRSFMREVNLKYTDMLGQLQLTTGEIVFISFCAGLGEEFLFRGTLQPLMGIVPTAVIFVALHGYISFKDWRITIYGIYMTLVIVALGWFTHELGILSAIIAHTIIDIVLLKKIEKQSDLRKHRALFDSDQSYNES